MKIYTEEQVKDALNLFLTDDYIINKIVKILTPIELPSEEEIINEAKIPGMPTSQELCFQLGAKWMINKILNK